MLPTAPSQHPKTGLPAVRTFPDPRKDLESRSLKGVPIKHPVVVSGPKSRVQDFFGGLGSGLRVPSFGVLHAPCFMLLFNPRTPN